MNSTVRILVVDDEPDILNGTGRLLENSGYTVEKASSGEAALRAIRERRPDIVLVDREMPNIDGLEVCRRLKQDPVFRDIFVIIASETSAKGNEQSGLEPAADGYISHPIPNHQFLAQVESYVRILTLTRSLQSKADELQKANDRLEVVNHELQREIDERKRATSGLRESEEKFSKVFRGSPNAILITNFDGLILDANESFTRLTGFAREEALGRTTLEIKFWADPSRRQVFIEQLRAKNRVEGLEADVRDRHGALRTVLFSGEVMDLGGGPAVVGEVLDITERKQADAALRANEAEFRAVFELASVGMAQANPKTGRLLRVNQKLASITGYSISEILQMSVSEITHPDDREKDWISFQQVVKGEMPDYRIEKRYVRKDKSIAWVNVNMTLIRDAGEPLRTFATIEDITQRKRVEEALRENQYLLQNVLNFNPGIVFIKSLNGRFLMVNRQFEEQVGVAGNQVVGKSDDEIFPAEQAAALKANDALVFESGNPISVEETVQLADGARTSLVTKFPLRDAAGQIYAMGGIAIDITDRKHAEKRIQQLNRVYSVLSDINQTIVREKNREAMLSAACRIAVEKGQYLMAWLGMLDPKTQIVTPVASAGHIVGYLDNINIDLKDEARRRGPVAQSVLSGKHIVCADIETDPIFGPWRDGALRRGYRSSASFPVQVNGQTVASFSLYASESNFFDPYELQLLDKLALDIGYALDMNQRDAEHKKSEAALVQSEERYRLLAEHASDVIWVLDVATETYRYISPSVERLRGFTPEEVLRQGVAQSMTPASAQFIHSVIPSRLERFRQGYIEIYRDEIEQLHKDGHIIASEITSRFMLNPATGRIESTGVTRDITERKRADEAHARLATAVEQAAESIVITDINGNILYVNPAFEKTTGYSRVEAIGNNPRLLKSGKHDGAFYRGMWQVLSRGDIWKGHLINKRKDGALFEEHATISPIRDATGRIVNYVAVKRDVTREVQLEAQFRQSQKMEAFGLLAGGVAHDFNNLLGVVLGYCDIWLMKLPQDAPIRDPLRAIRSAGDRAAALTKQLLAFSRQTVLEPKIVDLNVTVRETEKMLARIIGEDIHLSSILNPGIPKIRIDPGQISQVLMNLAVNARDAMPCGGSLTIQTGMVEFDDTYVLAHPGALPGRQVLLSVSDTGTGMSPEILARIFEPFFTTKGVGKGTGLGLAVVHGAVTQSGGSIQVESEVGSGTTFKLYFPVTLELGAPANTSGEIMAHIGMETILIAEDEASLLDLTAMSLETFGYNVISASNGGEALDLFNRAPEKIDLLLTDVVMPGMSGRSLAETIRRKRPDLKVIFMSGYTDDSVVRHGINHEKVAFLQKPFAPYDLIKKIREVLDAP